ncbi:MAG TPA: NUDIX domain-containing protein [Bryobacteraceae bacterium]|nr:NUDIX domain-containing protein [Bryobacteraceae bacterium]
MQFYERFSYCPECGEKYTAGSFISESTSFVCSRCSYQFFQNTRPSATAVIPALEDPARVLMITRATNPGMGLLACPGGFLEYAEEPSVGAEREALEETSLNVTAVRLLCCYMINYVWSGATVSVVELAYLMRPISMRTVGAPSDEATKVGYHSVDELIDHPERLAFPVQARALALYRDHITPEREAVSSLSRAPFRGY